MIRNLQRVGWPLLLLMIASVQGIDAANLCGNCMWNTRCGQATGNCGTGKLYGVRWTHKTCYELGGVSLEAQEVTNLHGEDDDSCWVESIE